MASHQSSLKDPKDQSSSSSSRTSKVDSNALRLRENQRRSRLRKKEYLASLETRFRDCQRAGIEASVEVQTAAKRVVRENIRLRELLRAKGVPDTEVDVWVRDTASDHDRNATVAPVDAAIKALARRPCAIKADTTEESGRRKSTGMMNERSPNGNGSGSGGGGGFSMKTREDVSGRQTRQQQETTPPRSSLSPTDSHSSLSPTPSFSALPMTPPPAVVSDPHPTSRRPSFPQSSPGYTSGMGQRVQDLYSFHSLSSPPSSHSSPASATQFSDRFLLHQNQQQLHFIGHDTHSSMPCDVARSMIVQMATEGNVDVLTRELCPHGSLQGCVVNTGVLFNVMDRTCV
ncbi:hypothetical protein BDD12DRAFT_810035 [Trichophaea hybrida]|nr:hypothetical protein BDD12DRAFT_810035 [Trichophaea hybrida]